MAENIFAVSIRRGLVTADIDVIEVVSCGAPIPGVSVKLVDGEIWLKSPAPWSPISAAPMSAVLAPMEDEFDCLLIRGAMGQYDSKLPTVALQHIAKPWRTRNFEQFGDLFDHLGKSGALSDHPTSGGDWYHVDDLAWDQGRDIWAAERTASDDENDR